jgi:hypothetical protein
VLAAARVFLFGARDVWFVVALPVYLSSAFGWDHARVGGFLALWIIGYGVVQALAPRITRARADGRDAFGWAAALALAPALIALALGANIAPQASLLGGLLLFGALFAVNSGAAQLPDRELRARGRRLARRGLLLHGECARAPARHRAVGLGVPGERAGGLPVDLGGVRGSGGADHGSVRTLSDGLGRAGHRRGVGLGLWLPGVFQAIAALEFAHVNLVVAVFIWVMIYPMMIQIDWSAVKDVGRKPRGSAADAGRSTG